ncbi:hypothetical protein M5K25_026796 [Dendrobium thyrsiflorum]|uniref:BED-type domain-containing protein n=1 Tax=Dendrobium thyrsiflorum TaxID=117978 RepID=A0ABD0TYB0_DENTH
MVRGKEKSNASLRRDPSWKYSVQVDIGGAEKTYVYLKCNFYDKVVKGGVTRMKEHLSGLHKNVAPCANVPDKVKEEISAYMKKSTPAKHLQHEQFDDRVEHGSYYGSESGKGSSSTIHSRGARGPMDQYMVNPREDRGQTQMMPAAASGLPGYWQIFFFRMPFHLMRLRNKGLKDDEDPLVCEDVASDNEWFIDDETDLPLSDLQLEDLSVDVLRGEADQRGASTSATPHTSTSSAAQQANKASLATTSSPELKEKGVEGLPLTKCRTNPDLDGIGVFGSTWPPTWRLVASTNQAKKGGETPVRISRSSRQGRLGVPHARRHERRGFACKQGHGSWVAQTDGLPGTSLSRSLLLWFGRIPQASKKSSKSEDNPCSSSYPLRFLHAPKQGHPTRVDCRKTGLLGGKITDFLRSLYYSRLQKSEFDWKTAVRFENFE